MPNLRPKTKQLNNKNRYETLKTIRTFGSIVADDKLR